MCQTPRKMSLAIRPMTRQMTPRTTRPTTCLTMFLILTPRPFLTRSRRLSLSQRTSPRATTATATMPAFTFTIAGWLMWGRRQKSRTRDFYLPYAFGYNLTDADMNRDRGVVDAWKANCEIGKLWASVTDEEMLERFWQAVKDGMGEKDCQMHGVEIGNKRGMRQAFQAVYGQDAVLKTSPEMGREAAYRGAKPVSKAEVGGYGLEQVVEELVGTDAQHVAQLEGKTKVYIPDRKLNAEQLKALSVVRRLARRAGIQGRIAAYILPEGILGETNREDVRMSLLALTDPEKAIGTWLHEEAHRMNGTADDTAAHATAIAVLAARVIAGYATR